jgi:hypothetical protein
MLIEMYGHNYVNDIDKIWLTDAVAAAAAILVTASVCAEQSVPSIAAGLQCGSASVLLTPARTDPAALSSSNS